MPDSPSPRSQNGVFLSSTNDPVVKPFRLAAREVIESGEFRDKWYAEDMSEFPPDRLPPADVCENKVLGCAVYVGILGPIYGSICQSVGKSYVEYEYQVALEADREIGIFVLPKETLKEEPYELFRNQIPYLERQDAFREAVRAHTTAPVASIDEFKRQLGNYLRHITLHRGQENPPEPEGPPPPGPESYDAHTLRQYRVSDLDQDILHQFLTSEQAVQDLTAANLLHAPLEAQLRGLGLATAGGVTRGAFLCFAPRHSIVNAQSAAGLHMVVYDGLDRTDTKYIYLRPESDNLTRLFDTGMKLFHTYLHRLGVPGSPDRDALEIPVIVLREALANALIHRDYEHRHAREQPTRIEIFADRIEITSFGGLIGDNSEEALNTEPEQVTAYRRNPIITRIFLYLTLAELSGGGVARMHHTMKTARLPQPRIIVKEGEPGSVRVILSRRSATSAPAPSDDLLLPLPKFFVGRDEEMNWVMVRLRRGASTGITALGGMGGIGKTALAAMATHELAQEGHFRDGIAVILCMGHTDAQEILQLVVDRFATKHHVHMPDSIDSLSSLQALLLDKKVLIVLDNVEPDLDLERVVTPLRMAGAVLLITARHKMPSAVVPADSWRELDRLPLAAALDLFAYAAGYSSTAQFGDAIAIAERIVRTLECHTLAVRLAGATLADPTVDIHALARELERDPLTLRAGASANSIERTLQRSVDSLSLSARRLFVAFSAFATEEFGRKAVLAVATTLRIAAPTKALNQLIARNLIDVTRFSPGARQGEHQRLRMHPLLWALSARLSAQLPATERMAAKMAVASFFANHVQTATEHDLSADPLNIAGALEWACDQGQDAIIVALCAAMHPFWNHRWLTRVSARFLPLGIQAADRIAAQTGAAQDQLRAADLELAYAQIQRRIGDLEGAERALLANLAVRGALADRRGEGVVLSQLGLTTRAGGRTNEAQSYLERSVAIRHETHDQRGEAEDLSLLARLARTRGDLDQATRYFEQCLAVFRTVGDRRSEGVNLGYFAQIPILRGNLAVAEEWTNTGLDIAREVSNRRGEAESLSLLAQIARIRGRADDAERFLHLSLAIRHEVLDLRGQGADIGLLGRIAQARGQLHIAQRYFQQSLDIAKKVSDRRGEAAVLSSLGQLGLARGDYAEAETYLTQSLRMRREVQDRQGEAIDLSQFGRLHLDRGNFAEAERYLKLSLAIDREMRDRPGEGVDLSQLGLVALESKRYEEASDYLRQSLPIRRAVQDRRGEGIDLALLGKIALDHGRLDEAEHYFQQSLNLAQKVENRRGEGVNLRRLAAIAEARGEFSRAEEHYRSSLAIGNVVENGLDRAESLEELGQFLVKHRQETETGCQMLHEAAECFRRMKVPGEERVQATLQRLGCDKQS